MATKAAGVFKKVTYKKEVIGQWGEVPAVTTGGQYLRRTSSDFNLTKDTLESAELNPSFQLTGIRTGVGSAEGSLSGEFSPKSYADFFGSVLAKDFVAGASATGLTLAVAASGQYFTLTRSTGSWLTDGVKVGNVVRITAGTGADPANLNNNLLVLSMTATVLTVQVLSRVALVVQASITVATVSVTGKTTLVPLTGHTDDSYSIEQYYADISQSELYTGLKVTSAAVSVSPSGLSTVDFSFSGKDLAQTGASEFFTSPTNATTTGLLAGATGALIVNGAPGACITDASINIERNTESTQCIGSTAVSSIAVGKIRASGSCSAYFSDGTFRDLYRNETNVSVVLALTESNEKNANVVAFVFPKVRFMSATNADSENSIVQSIDWTALLNDVTTGGLPETTVMMQDTALV